MKAVRAWIKAHFRKTIHPDDLARSNAWGARHSDNQREPLHLYTDGGVVLRWILTNWGRAVAARACPEIAVPTFPTHESRPARYRAPDTQPQAPQIDRQSPHSACLRRRGPWKPNRALPAPSIPDPPPPTPRRLPRPQNSLFPPHPKKLLPHFQSLSRQPTPLPRPAVPSSKHHDTRHPNAAADGPQPGFSRVRARATYAQAPA